MGNKRRLIRAIDPQSVKKALASIAKRKEARRKAEERETDGKR